MFQIDPIGFIPQSLKDAALDSTIDFLSGQAKKFLGDEISAKIKKLRTDAAFQQAFEKGFQRALRRFSEEYVEQDEDLVAAIAGNPNLFKNEELQQALLVVLKNPGSYLDEDEEKIVAAFETVLPERKNRSRVNQAIQYLLKCLVQEVWNLPELQPIYSLQFQRLTAEATRQQVAIQKAQLQAIQQMDGGIRNGLLRLVDAIAEQKLLPPGTDAPLLQKPKVLHNLPNPDYGRFIGRDNELAQVVRILRPYPYSQHSVVTIDGVGGIGKSALALEVAHRYLRNYAQIPEEDRFDAIVWCSAKKTVLTPDGIKTRHPTFQTLGDLILTIAFTLQREDIPRYRPQEQLNLVRDALTKCRTLIIVDNLETVDDEEVATFLQELPAPTKAIVTTRIRIDATFPVHLTGMPWADAQELILQTCHKKQVELDHRQIQLLFRRTGGVPIAFHWSIAQMSFGYGIDIVLKRLGDAKGDIAEFCFKGSLAKINGTPAYQILMALTLFIDGATRSSLGFIADLSELDRDDGLVVLERLSLFDRQGERFRLSPLTKEFATHELNGLPDIKAIFTCRRIEYLKDICKSVDGQYYWRRFHNRGFVEEAAEIIDALQWSLKEGTADDVFQLGYAALDYLDSVGRWDDYTTICQLMLRRAETISNHIHIARCKQGLGWLCLQKGEYQEGKILVEDSVQHYELASSKEGVAIALQHLSSAYRKMKEYALAQQYNDQAWDIAISLDDGDLKALITTNRGKLERDKGDWELAWATFSEVKEWFERRAEQSPRDEMLARSIWGHLGIIAYRLGRYIEAKELLEKSLQYSVGYGTLSGAATTTYRLALAEEATGDSQSAMKHVQEALDCFARLGMKPDYADAKELFNRLRPSSG
jgi:LuxR family glucitol operon transcriptional activator